MSILMRVRLVFCGVAMKIPPAKIRHMKTPYNSMQMWNMALTVIILSLPPTLPAPKTCLSLSCVMIPLNRERYPEMTKQESAGEYPCLCHTGYHIVCAFECGEGD